MRHNNKINSLGRKSAHRKAMLSNMASSLIMHKRIQTTLAKAKALRVFIEPIITKSKVDTTHSRRLAFSYLQDKNAVSELFREISPRVLERPGGYTRILKTGKRLGDSAEMCYIELVDFNESMLAAKVAAETKATRRSRRGSKKKAEADVEMKAKPTVAADESKPGTGEVEPDKTETKPEPENKARAEAKIEKKPEQKKAAVKSVKSETKESTESRAEGDEERSEEETGSDIDDKNTGSEPTAETESNKE